MGDTITVGQKSLAIVELKTINSIKKFKIEELSSFTLQTHKINEDDDNTIVELLRGSLFILVRKIRSDKISKLTVKAGNSAMGIRGTQLYVSFGKVPTDLWMCVNEGEVEVLYQNKKETVKSGKGVFIKSQKGIGPPKLYSWTQKLNWNMDPNKGDINNTINIEDAYLDLLDQDYD